MKLKKNDFIEIEFTAKTLEDNQIFDSNIKEDLEKIKPDIRPEKAKPLVFALGQSMFLSGVEEFLLKEDIEKGKKIKVELPVEKAFGKRQSKLIQRVPSRIFKEHDLNPVPGYMFNFDGRVGKVLAASGGRVIVDFNNPIAGKDVVYEIKILRKVDDLEEKINALNEFFFRKKLDFEIEKEKKKIIFDVTGDLQRFIGVFSEKYKDILGFEIDFKKKKSESEKKKPEESKKKN